MDYIAQYGHQGGGGLSKGVIRAAGGINEYSAICRPLAAERTIVSFLPAGNVALACIASRRSYYRQAVVDIQFSHVNFRVKVASVLQVPRGH